VGIVVGRWDGGAEGKGKKKKNDEETRKRKEADLLEDVVKESVVGVVIHDDIRRTHLIELGRDGGWTRTKSWLT
jgi:hypothetical protein